MYIKKVARSSGDVVWIFALKEVLLYLEPMVWLQSQVLARCNNRLLIWSLSQKMWGGPHYPFYGDKRNQTGSTKFSTFIFQFVSTLQLTVCQNWCSHTATDTCWHTLSIYGSSTPIPYPVAPQQQRERQCTGAGILHSTFEMCRKKTPGLT